MTTSFARFTSGLGLAVIPLLLLCHESWAAANPPLQNPGFEIVGPNGPITIHSPPAPGGAGVSAADGWGVFHNTVPGGGATTETAIVPTTLPFSNGVRMLRVTTDQPLNGITQTTGPPHSGALQGIGSAWIYVVSGVVGVGTGDAGNTIIDVTSSTTGTWEYLQAPSTAGPVNLMIIYAVGGPAEFYVDDASLDNVQEADSIVRVEYSNLIDEQSIAAGGGHAGGDPGQTLYTEVIDGALDPFPLDGIDFFPAIETGTEPDSQIDALANGTDFGFAEVVSDQLDLAFSTEGDVGPTEPVGLWVERVSGANELLYTHRFLHALDTTGEIEDVDAVEMWGRVESAADPTTDVAYYSLEGDLNDVSVWTTLGGIPTPYLTRSLLAARLLQIGFTGAEDEVDLDALLVKDTTEVAQWSRGDEILFSIRAAANFDGGEIVHLGFGQPATFLQHGGHAWNTAHVIQNSFPTDSEEVDAIEVPEPGVVPGLLCGALLLAGLRLRRLRPRER